MNTYNYMLYGSKKHIFQSYSRAYTHTNDEGKKPVYLSDDGQVVITYLEDDGYRVVTSGRICKRITSKTECEKAAIDLGLPDKVAEYETSGYPRYCYIWDNQLYFNDNGNADKECNTESGSNACICHDGKVECQ